MYSQEVLNPLMNAKQITQNNQSNNSHSFIPGENWSPHEDQPDNYSDPTLNQKRVMEFYTKEQKERERLELENKRLENERLRLVQEQSQRDNMWQWRVHRAKNEGVSHAHILAQRYVLPKMKSDPYACKGIGVFLGYGISLYACYKVRLTGWQGALCQITCAFGGYQIGKFCHQMLVDTVSNQDLTLQ